MTNKEKQEWLEVKYPLTIIPDRYDGTYSGASWLAFPLYCDEIPPAVNGYDEDCAAFWKAYYEPVGKGSSAQAALDDLIRQMRESESEESEDERIRNEILIYIGAKQDIDLETHNRWCTYLEKQKEQKHPNGCFTCDEYKKGYEAGRFHGFTAGYNKAMKEQKPDSLIKYVYSKDKKFIQDCANILVANDYTASAERLLSMFEQKPTDKQDYSGLSDFERAIHRGFLSAGVENVPVAIIKETAQECLVQIKPAEWSDTKELVFKDICNHLEVEGYSGWVVLLNALHNGEFQPKAEWSEEDERIIHDASIWISEYAGVLVSSNENKADMLWKLSRKLLILEQLKKL